MNPLISIIVPIYKVEKYLEKCICSLLNQTYSNIEIILVDDGSPDGCAKICDEYAESYSNIIVIHKENGGLSDARNYGLKVSSGQMVYFVDSDDYLSKDCIELLYKCKISTNTRISVSDFIIVREDEEEIENRGNFSPYIVFTTEEALTSMFYQDLFDTSANNKLFDKELFDDITFPFGKIFEDLATIYKVILKSSGISFINNSGYYYVQRKGSIENSDFSNCKLDMLTITSEIEENLNTCSDTIKKAMKCRIISGLFHVWLEMPKTIKEYEVIKKVIKKNRFQIIMDARARKKTRAGCLLSYFSFSIVRICFQIFKAIK